MQLLRQIFFGAREHEDDPALASAAGVVSYRTMAKSVTSAAQTIENLGLEKGAFVLLDVQQPLHHVYLVLALALLGFPSGSLGREGGVPHNGPKVRMIFTDRAGPAFGDVATRNVSESWFAFDARGPVDYYSLLLLWQGTGEDEVIRYLYSSGTTGHAKCVAYTARLMDARVRAGLFSVAGGDSPRSASLNLMGLSTMSGMLSLLRTLSLGGLFCLADTPAAAIDLIRLFKVERLHSSVGQLQTLVTALHGRTPLVSLKTVMVTGARLPMRLLAETRARLCPDVIFAYGSTEAYLISVGRGPAIDGTEGAVGYLLPGVGLEVIGTDGIAVRPGQDGTLRVRPLDAPFYVDVAGLRTEVVDSEGWFAPGDVGRMQPDGLLVLTGRDAEVINRGGTIVAPEVVEEVFRRDHRVGDVAAIAVPQSTGVDEIWVAVVAKEPIDLQKLVTDLNPALGQQAPNRAFQVAAIPRNENLKVRRRTLRDELIKLASR